MTFLIQVPPMSPIMILFTGFLNPQSCKVYCSGYPADLAHCFRISRTERLISDEKSALNLFR